MKLKDPKFIAVQEPFLKYLLGPGLPIGRILEVGGVPGAGKSMLCCHFAKYFDKVHLIDTEKSYSRSWVAKFTDPNKFEVYYPTDSESLFFELLPRLVTGKETELVVIDSSSALQSREDQTSDQLAIHAKLYSKGLRVCGTLNQSKVIVFVSHLKLNPLRPGQVVRLGGEAISFHSALQIAMKKRKSGNDVYCIVSTVKNKVFKPFRVVTLRILDDFDETTFLSEFAKRSRLIEGVGGGWFSVPDGRKLRLHEALEVVKDDILKVLEKDYGEAVLGSGESIQDWVTDEEQS